MLIVENEKTRHRQAEKSVSANSKYMNKEQYTTLLEPLTKRVQAYFA